MNRSSRGEVVVAAGLVTAPAWRLEVVLSIPGRGRGYPVQPFASPEAKGCTGESDFGRATGGSSPAAGEPVAYLVGRREFYSLPFQINRDVLIPRPETEHLVIRLLDLAAEHDAGAAPRIADVGTGSGIIAVCAARAIATARVTAIDRSAAALEVARANAALHQVSDRIDFLEGDLLAPVSADARFDFVVSNPPYVTTAEMEQLSPTVRNFEPRQALEAGAKGTEVIERLIPQAAERLRSGGHLLMEISPMLDQAVRALIKADERFEPGPTRKDLAGQARVVQAQRR